MDMPDLQYQNQREYVSLTVLSPYTGSATIEARAMMEKQAVDKQVNELKEMRML